MRILGKASFKPIGLEAGRDRPLRASIRSPWWVAAVVLVAYGFWLAAFFGSGHDPRDTIYIGRRFITQSQSSQVIRLDPSYPNLVETGYDGQFFYYLALDPVNARYYMDVSTYRYTRILYPMLARVLALGRPALIPWTLLLINWFAIAGGTLAIAAWLRRRGLSAWFGLVYGFYPGLHIVLQRDLSEALGYGLLAAAVYVFDFGPGRRELLAAGVFALAALTRETTAVFALVYAAALLLEGGAGWRDRLRTNWFRAVLFGAIAIGPLVLYKLFLLAWLGAGHDVGIPLARLPLQGLWHWRYWAVPSQMEEMRSVVFPGLIAGGVAAYALYRRILRPEVVILLANVILFIVFLQAEAYVAFESSSRVAIGVVLAALLALVWLGAQAGHRAWFWICSALWLSLVPFWVLFPVVQYGFHLLHNLRG